MASTEIFAGEEWRGRVGASWAAEWVRTDRSFGVLTARLVDALTAALPSTAAPAPKDDTSRRRVLDIGCGAGETSLRLAGQRPDLQVTGLDLSEKLIAVASLRGAWVANLAFEAGDASSWHDERPFDAALSRHGMMFFDDPIAAFGQVHAQMVPGAPLLFTCFAAREDNPWANELAALIGTPPPANPHAPGPFAFADADHVRQILEAAGWQAASAERIDYDYVPGGGENPVADALDFFGRIGPAAQHLAMLDVAARRALEPRIAQWLGAHVVDDEVRFPAAAWLWRAAA